VGGITHVLVASISKASNLAAFTSPVITYATFQMIQANMNTCQKYRKINGSEN